MLGEKPSRYVVVGMMILQYLSVAYLVLTRFLTPAPLLVLLALPTLSRILPMFRRAASQTSSRTIFQTCGPTILSPPPLSTTASFGLWFLLGLFLDMALKVWILN